MEKKGGWARALPALCAAALWVGWAFAAALNRAPAAPADGGGEAEMKLIALTFDDGPRRSTTERLLEGLAERGVRCTFFLIGAQVPYNRDLVERMEAEGHQIGIHTYDHVQLTGLSKADFDDQVGRTRQVLGEILGREDFLLRPPYGAIDEGVRRNAECPLILWSIDPEDWRDKDAGRVTEHVVSRARDGAVILLHDIYPSSVEAALAIVDELHSRGYLFVTVDELFSQGHIPLEPGKSYRCVEE